MTGDPALIGFVPIRFVRMHCTKRLTAQAMDPKNCRQLFRQFTGGYYPFEGAHRYHIRSDEVLNSA